MTPRPWPLCSCSGLEHIDFSDEELRPLVQFMLNGRKKAFLCLDAGSYLGLPEMSMPLKKIHTPHDYNFSNYLPISIVSTVNGWYWTGAPGDKSSDFAIVFGV